MVESVSYKCECGKKYHTKRAAINHENVCKCWKNPKHKTCVTCKFGKRIKDSNGMESNPQFLQTWKQWTCSNPLMKDEYFTAAHSLHATDLCINCPIHQLKE